MKVLIHSAFKVVVYLTCSRRSDRENIKTHRSPLSERPEQAMVYHNNYLKISLEIRQYTIVTFLPTKNLIKD